MFEILKDKITTKQLLSLSWPIIIANILLVAYNLTDMFWVGRLGAGAVAAVSMSFPVIFLIVSLGGGISIAGTILVAQYKGEGNKKEIDYISAQVLVAVVIIAVILSVIGFLVSQPLLAAMGANAEILSDATLYLQTMFIGLTFLFIFTAYQGLFRGVGDVKVPMYIVLVTVILNFILDPIFILGYGPIPAYGVNGAAITTIFTQMVACIAGIWIMLGGKRNIHLKIENMHLNFSLMWKMIKLGLPASIEQITHSLSFMVMIFLVSGFGTVAIAAYGIGSRISSLVIIPALGLSTAVTTLVGQNVGAGRIDGAEKTSKIGMFYSFVILGAVGLLLILFATPLSAFFIPNDAVAIAESADFIFITSLTLGFAGVVMIVGGTFRGTGKTFIAMMISLTTTWFLRIPIAYVLSTYTVLGVDGIWWAFSISAVITFFIAFVLFWKGLWKAEKLTDEFRTVSPMQESVT